MKRGTKSANLVKMAQGIRPFLRGVFFRHFSKISVTFFQFLGSYTLIFAPMG